MNGKVEASASSYHHLYLHHRCLARALGVFEPSSSYNLRIYVPYVRLALSTSSSEPR